MIVSLRGLTPRRGKCYTSSSFASARKGAPARCRSAGRLVIERGEGIMRSESATIIRSSRFCVPVLCFSSGIPVASAEPGRGRNFHYEKRKD